MANNGNPAPSPTPALSPDQMAAREAFEDMNNLPMGPAETIDTYPEVNSAPIAGRPTTAISPAAVSAPNIPAQAPNTPASPGITEGATAAIMKPKTPSSVWRGLLAGALTGLAGASQNQRPGDPLSGAGAGVAAAQEQIQKKQEIARQQKQQEFENKQATDEAEQRKMLNQAQIAASNVQAMHTQQLIHQSDVETRAALQTMAKDQLQPIIDSGGAVLAQGVTSDQINDMIKKGQIHPAQNAAYQDGETELLGADGRPVAYVTQSGEEAEPGQTQKRATYTVVSVPPEVTVTPQFAAQAAKYGYKIPAGTQMDGVAYHNLSQRLQNQESVSLTLQKTKADILQAESEASKNNASAQLARAQAQQLGMFPAVDPSSPQAQAANQAFAPYLTAASKQTGKAATDPDTVQAAINQFALNPKTRGMVGVIAAQSGVTPTGNAFLATVPPNVAAAVKAVGDYQVDLSKATSYRGNQKEQFLAQVRMYNPNFDETQFPARQKLRVEMTSGKGAGIVRSLNTAIGHMGDLQDAATALNNGSVRGVNAVRNYFRSQFGNPNITNFAEAKNAVSGELAAVFKASGATDSEIKSWADTLDASMSPAQLQGAIETGVNLLGRRLSALNDQFLAGMQRPEDFHFLSPQSAAELKRLAGNGANALLQTDGYDPNKISAGPAPRNTGGQVQPRAGAPPAVGPASPQTRIFSPSAWAKANPGGDMNAAIAAAKAQGYQVQQ
jgi:hypothetical protein